MFTKSEYPYNLLLTAKGKTMLELPPKLNNDILAGLYYSLSTLTQPEQDLLHLRYEQRKSVAETADLLFLSINETTALEHHALQKLRLPSRWNYIRFGIAGWQRENATKQYNRGYYAGYIDGAKDSREKVTLSQLKERTELQPIAMLELSTRACNCLTRAGCTYIHEVAAMQDYTIRQIRNLGPITANEIAKALQNAGISHTAWYQFIL